MPHRNRYYRYPHRLIEPDGGKGLRAKRCRLEGETDEHGLLAFLGGGGLIFMNTRANFCYPLPAFIKGFPSDEKGNKKLLDLQLRAGWLGKKAG